MSICRSVAMSAAIVPPMPKNLSLMDVGCVGAVGGNGGCGTFVDPRGPFGPIGLGTFNVVRSGAARIGDR